MNTPRIEELPPLRRRRGLRRLKDVPVLPSLITLGNLCFGFLAIAKVADALRLSQPGAPFSEVVGLFETAAVLVFVAMVCDALDGRVARMTGQTTPFGAQLDSMADMVAFGAAPAFLGKARRLHWPIPDPASKDPSIPREEMLRRFRTARDTIREKLEAFARESRPSEDA